MTKSVCLFGPPGTGKTRSLIDIAEREVERSAKVQFLSFTKAAASEAASRINSKRIEASTLHSVAYRTLGVSKGQVVDAARLQEFGATVGVPMREPREDALQVGDEYLDVISFAANQQIDLGEAYERFGRPGKPREFENFAGEYAQWKETFGYLDFDDMLVRLTKYKGPSVPVVILDEAQDCSPLQWEVFRTLTRESKRVYVAGDDDQAIYEWSGADPHAMIKYAEESNADVRVLEQSWRMPADVHTFVHDNILAQFQHRVAKSFKPRAGGRDAGVKWWGSPHAYPFGAHIANNGPGVSWLILGRDKFRILDLQRILNADLVPYHMNGGYSPWDNRTARTIRCITKVNSGGQPTKEEIDACALVLRTTPGNFDKILGYHWKDLLKLSDSQMSIYESVDLMQPINVVLSTIHQAKGREADRVVVDLELTPRVVENAMANRDSELRVMYVACTRAKEGLDLCGENLILGA